MICRSQDKLLRLPEELCFSMTTAAFTQTLQFHENYENYNKNFTNVYIWSDLFYNGGLHLYPNIIQIAKYRPKKKLRRQSFAHITWWWCLRAKENMF